MVVVVVVLVVDVVGFIVVVEVVGDFRFLGVDGNCVVLVVRTAVSSTIEKIQPREKSSRLSN